MSRINKVSFFTKEQYADLKFQHLKNVAEYKNFITDINVEIANKYVLGTKEGFLLPKFLGILKVTKSKQKKGIITLEKVVKTKGQEKEYNHHTFGYVYRFSWIKVINTNLGNTLRPKYKRMYCSDLGLLRFKPHRGNLKRPLAKILKNYIRDYDQHIY